MAHEIAHNVVPDHDENHGSLSTRLAVIHFPALRKDFGDISWGEETTVEEKPQSTDTD